MSQVDSTNTPIEIGDHVQWRGEDYTIKSFPDGLSARGFPKIEFNEEPHTDEEPDCVAVDRIPTIYLWREADDFIDRPGIAYDEEGNQLAFHVSSSFSWFKQDMMHPDKLAEYHNRYPLRYRIELIAGKEALFEKIPALAAAPLMYIDDYEMPPKFNPEDDPIPEDLRKLMNEIGVILEAAINKHKPGQGFMLMIFDMGEGGTLSYISNAERDGVLDTLEEFLERNRA